MMNLMCTVKRMMMNVENEINNEDGQGMVEYALIIGLIAIALIAGLTAMNGGMKQAFTRITTDLTTAATQ